MQAAQRLQTPTTAGPFVVRRLFGGGGQRHALRAKSYHSVVGSVPPLLPRRPHLNLLPCVSIPTRANNSFQSPPLLVQQQPQQPPRFTRSFSTAGTPPLQPPTTRKERIEAILTAKLQPTRLEVIATAEGCPGGSVTVIVESMAFKDLNLLKQHRLVKDLVKDEIQDVHAFRVQTSLPK
ncbi:BolA-like protein 3 [Balamuthia mandrillaris]